LDGPFNCMGNNCITCHQLEPIHNVYIFQLSIVSDSASRWYLLLYEKTNNVRYG
jgi:hypothetical protein